MTSLRGNRVRLSALAVVAVLLAAACGSSTSSGSGSTSGGTPAPSYRTLAVPKDFPTIQKAVDAAKDGDLVLISPGVYKEGVVVQTDNIVIRGLDRNQVIIDGEFTRDNGVKVLANGVAVENLTSRNNKGNGVFFTGDYDSKFILNGYRTSYVTTHNNGDYGVYAFNATRGQIDHAYGSGHPDSAFYIGQCNPCDAVITDSLAENNLLGYSGTNSSGNLYVVNSEFRNNRSGIVPNSQDGEKLAPQQDMVVAGNWVHDNNNPTTPQKNEDYSIAFGTGIVLVGTKNDKITRNLVERNNKVGIVIFLSPFTTPITEPVGNEIIDNVVSGGKEYGDIVLAMLSADKGTLGNCVKGNKATTYRPADLPTKAECGKKSDWTGFEIVDANSLKPGPPPVDYKTIVAPGPMTSMPDAATAPPKPAKPGSVPMKIELDKIVLPKGGAN